MDCENKVFLSVVSSLGACLVIGKMVVGSVFSGSCPIDEKIPIYLIVPGGLLVFTPIVFWLMIIYDEDSDRQNKLERLYGFPKNDGRRVWPWVAGILFGLFCFGWFICGTIWVFPVAKHVQYHDQNATQTYCNGNAFKFALGLTIIDWLIVGGLLIAGVCACCCCLCEEKPKKTRRKGNRKKGQPKKENRQRY